MFEIRKLGAKDISPLITIIGKIGIKDFAKSYGEMEVKEGETPAQVEQKISINFMATVVENLPKCMDDVFEFVADVTGKTKEEIENLDMDVFIELVVDIGQKEEFKKVFNLASRFFK